jgi:purine-binding chemotaxis protein CheW
MTTQSVRKNAAKLDILPAPPKLGPQTVPATPDSEPAPAKPKSRTSAMATETQKTVAKAGADGTQLVTFLLKDEEFGFDIMAVQEIIRLPKMSRLPHTPDYVEGVSNLRGVVLPIFDIRTRFGMKREEQTDRSRVLVIDIDGRRTGLLVDGVRQVTRVGRNEFEPPPAAIRNETADYIDGVVKLDNGKRIIIALDARRVCAFGAGEGAEIVDELIAKSAHKGNGAKLLDLSRAHRDETQSPGTPGAETQSEGTPRKGEKVHQLVSFQVGREEFAFPMEHVREILRVQTPKEVPGAPDHLLGVLTVRGQILPIVDLRRLLRQSSFAADQVAACTQASGGYRVWLEQNGGHKVDIHGVVAASELLRRWLADFNSSSQALTETLAKARTLNEHVNKQAASSAADATGREGLHLDIDSSAKAVLALLRTFEEQVEGNIREDQRIIVVDSNGFQLGLVVDHVNEVLSVPDDAVEAPPSIAHQDGVGLSGIAKLDDGNRLILLLSTGNLLDPQKMAEIAEGVEVVAGGVMEDAVEAKHAERESKSGQDDEELQLVTFLLGKEEYGIPIAKIQEIDRLSKITQTPKAPKFVEGVTNLRGEVIPVLSTRALFALESKVSDDRTRVIIVDLGGAKTGLVVDSVKEVLSISSRNIAPPPASISNAVDGQFISGIGKVDDGKRMIVLLDVGRVLTRGEQSELAALGRSA